EGEVLGLIGPNGAGKTTLFNVVAGALRASAGTIKFAGSDISGFRPYRICRLGLCRTFQIVKPFGNLSVLDNVVIGAFTRCADRRSACRVAEEIGTQSALARCRDSIRQSMPV